MPSQKYLFLYRNQPGQPAPSPQEMQDMYAKWSAWKEKFKDHVVEWGDKLKPSSRVVTGSGVTDGPFVERQGNRGRLHDRVLGELRSGG